MLNDRWYGYVYPKNLDKQDWPKLIVAQTVPNLRVCFDEAGTFALNNVRVNGIVPLAGTNPWYLLGILNARVADFVFRRTAKPKDNNYFEANRQFIKDLPIPKITEPEQHAIADLARTLQALHTQRRDILDAFARRLEVPTRLRQPEWLFHGLPDLEQFALRAPEELGARQRRARSLTLRETEIARREAAILATVRPGANLTIRLQRGELNLLADGAVILDRVFVTTAEAPFVQAIWRRVVAITQFTEKLTGRALCDLLRRVPPATDPALVESIIELAAELDDVETKVGEAERILNKATFEHYDLTAEERAMVLAG